MEILFIPPKGLSGEFHHVSSVAYPDMLPPQHVKFPRKSLFG